MTTDICLCGASYTALGAPMREVHDAFWTRHATCDEPTTDAVVAAANDGNGS